MNNEIDDAFIDSLAEDGNDVILSTVREKFNKLVYIENQDRFEDWAEKLLERVGDADQFDFTNEEEMDNSFYEIYAETLLRLYDISGFKSQVCINYVHSFPEIDILVSTARNIGVDMLEVLSKTATNKIDRMLYDYPHGYIWSDEIGLKKEPDKLLRNIIRVLQPMTIDANFNYQRVDQILSNVLAILESDEITTPISKNTYEKLSYFFVFDEDESEPGFSENLLFLKDLILPKINIEDFEQRIATAKLIGVSDYKQWRATVLNNEIVEELKVEY